ncbi:hypothetical protein C0583_04620 [Candidatus Parcubacteria bacterium]|nr:MAG: hypothetical protein C0583_04620 [Candidatus Parcubacteria bacterium]
MGDIKLNEEGNEYHFHKIRKKLPELNLSPCLDETWKIHGPHEEMDYQVYVGYVEPLDSNKKCKLCKKVWSECELHNNYKIVAVYPDKVYEISDVSRWVEDAIEENEL